MRKQTLILGILALTGLAVMAYTNNSLAKLAAAISKTGSKWNNLVPAMQQRAAAVMDALARQGIIVGIPSTGGWRSEAMQQSIAPSNTRVVDPRDSWHVWGCAVDFVPINAAGAFHWPDNSDPIWQKIGAAIKTQGLEWGGDWGPAYGFVDMPHGELKISTLSYLKATYSDPLAFVQHIQNGGALA